MTRLLFSLFAVASLILISCSPVRTVTPVAKETAPSLQEEFQGTWKMGEGVFKIAFDDEGVGHFSWVEWKNNEFVINRGKFNAVESKDGDEIGFISIQVEQEEEDGAYLLGAFKLIEPDSILLWEAEPFSRYESLLDEGGLKGSIGNPDTHAKKIVFDDGAKLMDKIDRFSDYFDLEEPYLLTRIVPKSEAD